MIWLAEHLTGLAWTATAWLFLWATFAGALYRHTPRIDDTHEDCADA